MASKTLEVQVHEEEVEADEADDQEHQERLDPHISRRSRSPPVPPSVNCDVDRDPQYDDSASDSNSDSGFLGSPTLLRSRPPHGSRYRYHHRTTTAGSDGLFPYHLYDLSSKSSPSQYYPDPDAQHHKEMFSLIHNPRTFLRFIFGIVFLMCFLTKMVSGGPLAQHLRDAFHGHRPWGAHEDLRRNDNAESQSPLSPSPPPPPPQGGGVIRVAAAPIQIDPEGVYIRASPLYDPNGHPDTSRIIAGYAATDGPDRVLRVSSSTDSGASWSALGEVTRLPLDGTSDLDNAMPLALPSGRILFAFRNHSLVPSSSGGYSYTHYRLTVCSSSDGGLTWSFLSHIDERPASSSQKNGLWEPFLRLAADGRTIQAYYSSENSGRDQNNLMRFSTDSGKTWSDPPILVSNNKNSRDGMTGVAPVFSGSSSSSHCKQNELICVFETTSPHDGTFSIARVLSHDDGRTWGDRQTVYTASNKKWAGAPQVYLVGDTLVTSFLTNEGTDLRKIDGAYTKIVTSRDQGKTWTATGQAETVAGVGSHWPAEAPGGGG
ncbi:hypothetical protein N0V85_005093 [Neurospora sp. IMI 360204]|nr:hypothetical protein N0V85_005093 [Neurospora sp. IMI 360204]